MLVQSRYACLVMMIIDTWSGGKGGQRLIMGESNVKLLSLVLLHGEDLHNSNKDAAEGGKSER
jgi:hypothetical protein